MKKTKFSNLLVAATLVVGTLFSSAMPAFAASSDIIDDTRTASVTVHKYDITAAQEAGVDTSSFVSTGKANNEAEAALQKYALKGVEFSYVKVGDIKTYQATGKDKNSVEVVYQIPDELATILNLTNPVTTMDSKKCYTSDAINQALSKALETNTATKDKLETYAGKNAKAMPLTDETGASTVTGLDLGLYLFVETKVPENVEYTTDPFFVSLPSTDVDGQDWFYDLNVYPKNQTTTPSLDKVVSENGTYADTATASEGDTVKYSLVSKLPKITSSATYLTQYTFEDTLCKGLSYNKDFKIAFYSDKEDAMAFNDNKILAFTGDDFTVDYSEGAEGVSTATIKPTASGLAKINTTEKLSQAYMSVNYSAKAHSDGTVVMGDDGNANDVTLTYSRTNTKESQTIKDKAIVYFYGVDLTKEFSDNKGDATKVQFVLENSTDNYFVTAKGENGVYFVTGTAATEADATKFAPAGDGTLKIYGLESDTYDLQEVATDKGYTLLRDKINIKIGMTEAMIVPSEANKTGIVNANKDVQYTTLHSGTSNVDHNAKTLDILNGMVVLTVTNHKSFLPPITGDGGVWALSILGVVLSGLLIIYLKRGSKKEEIK